MEQRGLYYSLLHSCMEKKDLLGGRNLHCLLVRDGLFSDPALCSHLIRVYSACGHLFLATQVFLQSSVSDVFTWSAIILAHAKLAEGEAALALFHKMQRSKLELDKHVVLAALKGCASISCLDHAQLIHFLVYHHGFEADLSLSNSLIDAYAKCYSLQDARTIFDSLHVRDIITWSALMTGYAQVGEGHVTFALYKQMQLEGLGLNRVTIISVLKACAGMAALESIKNCHAYVLAKGFESDRVVCNTLIDAYAKCGSLNEAHRVFKKLRNQDNVSWNAIIAAYTSHGHGEKSLHLFNQMRQEAIEPDKFTIVSLLKACSTIGALKDGKLVYTHLVENSFDSDPFISNALVDMYAKCGDLEEAHRIFDSLPEQSVVTWSAMVAGHAVHGQDDKALEVFLQMQKEKKNPDNYTFGSIVRSCANTGALDKGKLLHGYIIENCSAVDVVVGSALVDMYLKCNSLGDARTLFSSLGAWDVVTWSAIIVGCVQLGAPQEGLSLFRRMLQAKVTPNGVTYVTALNACSSLATLHEGFLIQGQIVESVFDHLDKLLGNALVDMYSKCGSIEDASKMFARMPDKDIVTWNALIAGYALQSEYRSALLHFERMQQEGFEPDDITFLSILSVCNHLGLVDQGRHHFTSMQNVYGITPTPEHSNCMADLLGRSGNLKDAGDLLQLVPMEARSAGVVSLLSNCSSHGDPGLGR